MEALVLVLMILVSFNFILKLTYSKAPAIIFIAALCAVCVGLMWPFAIEQSRSQIAEWLADTQMMLDTAVILTIEVCINISFCMMAVHMMTTGPVSRKTLAAYRLLRFFPGLLIIPVLFSIQVVLIFSFPGVSFPVIAWSMAAVSMAAIAVLALGLKRLLPSKELRLELLFVINVAITVIGIVATVNGKTAVSGTPEIDWTALAGILSLSAAGLATGCLAYRLRLKRLNKHKN